MKKANNRLVILIVAAGLFGGSLLACIDRVQAAPSEAAAKQVSVNINKADTAELESIRGIGPMLAERILQYRQANGRFERLEDLVQVPGIGQAKFEKIKDQITL